MKNEIRKITTLALLCSATLGFGATACEFHARSAEDYRDVTQDLLLTKQNEIKGCYDNLLKKDRNAGGIVRVTFKVEAETGQIKDAKVDPAGTTAPPELGECVVQTISGLALTPADKRDGLATFNYEFKSNG
jgi:hypothetical protein